MRRRGIDRYGPKVPGCGGPRRAPRRFPPLGWPGREPHAQPSRRLRAPGGAASGRGMGRGPVREDPGGRRGHGPPHLLHAAGSRAPVAGGACAGEGRPRRRLPTRETTRGDLDPGRRAGGGRGAPVHDLHPSGRPLPVGERVRRPRVLDARLRCLHRIPRRVLVRRRGRGRSEVGPNARRTGAAAGSLRRMLGATGAVARNQNGLKTMSHKMNARPASPTTRITTGTGEAPSRSISPMLAASEAAVIAARRRR